jgi:hypothetical protein
MTFKGKQPTMRKYIQGFAVLALAAVTASCQKDLTGINKNPNNPEVVPAKFLMVPAVRAVGTNSGAGALGYRMTGVWAQHIAEMQYADEDRYNFRSEDITTYWNAIYINALFNLNKIIEMDESPNQVAVAMILRAQQYQIATDLWGDIPFTEALKGDKLPADGGTSTPAYDKQSDIYAALLKDLKDAAAMLDASKPVFVPANHDQIYLSDVAKWKKFANSLRLRVAMRLSEVDPGRAQSEFQDALGGGVFTSNADNAVVRYTTDANTRHPVYTNALTRDDYAMSKSLVDAMTNGDATGRAFAQHDPRLSIFATQTVADTAYRGHQNGLRDNHGISFGTLSRIGDRWRKSGGAGDAVIMSYAEVLFLQAEAAARGWGGDATALSNDAISASMTYYGIEQAEVDAYLTAHPEWALDAAGSTPLRQIGIQKWIALFMNGPEAFTEWRRTGYPELKAGPDAGNGGQIIRRLIYPSSEQSYNMENLTKAKDSQGLQSFADMNTRLWWDKKPLVP